MVDVRDTEEYEKEHIPGAVNIPEMFYTLSMTTPEGIKEMSDIFIPLFSKNGISKDKTAIIYEDSLNTRYGGSCRGYFQLSFFGHPNVGILDGGLAQWKQDNIELTNEVTMPTSVYFDPIIQQDILCTMEDMKEALENPSIKLLDNRDEDEWLGISSSPYGIDFAPRKGRLKGARWIEWYNFMDTSGSIPHFKSNEEIQEICAQVGLYPDDDIIIYCFKGARASNTYLALKMAGFTKIRNYYGSWNEWSRYPELPIDDEVLAA